MEQKITGSNQGESSNEWKGVKTPYQMASVGNRDGAESSESPESEWGASSGTQTPFNSPSGQINITASTENRSSQFKYPNKSDDSGAGANQYV